ncbi:MAG: hypothetical protein JW918_18755 [Anaerolineae bacterium]|nr:hypothetical protein [Anaerolineae bacterium]
MLQTIARITCPNCQNQFQVPVEQVIDVRADPGAKGRVLNGLVNMAFCPQCGMGGALGLPFLYHDPNKEVAFVYMPMEAGRTDIERQQAIGKLTTEVMNGLPPEERKGYLLQPQVFFSMENLLNKLLELEGITPEMIEAQKAKVGLLQQMAVAESDEALEALIKENEEALDDEFFRLLAVNLQIIQSAGRDAGLERLMAVREKLLELTEVGKKVKVQEELVKVLQDDPSRETLLDLLVKAPDEEAREVLLLVGRRLVDYLFFQKLTARIDAASAAAEKKRLTALRQEVLDVRDRLDEAERTMLEQRAALLRDLLLSSDPENLARRRMAEIDQPFLALLVSEMQEAQEEGNEEAVKSLQAIWEILMRLSEESLPPVVRLLNRLMGVEDEGDIDKLLEVNRALVTPEFVELLERAQAGMQEDEEAPPESAERLALVVAKAKLLLG